MPNSTSIAQLITTYLAEDLQAADREELLPDRNLLAEGILDSISVMRLIRYLESSLQLKIPPRDLVPRNFMTIEAMANYLRGALQEQSEPKRHQA